MCRPGVSTYGLYNPDTRKTRLNMPSHDGVAHSPRFATAQGARSSRRSGRRGGATRQDLVLAHRRVKGADHKHRPMLPAIGHPCMVSFKVIPGNKYSDYSPNMFSQIKTRTFSQPLALASAHYVLSRAHTLIPVRESPGTSEFGRARPCCISTIVRDSMSPCRPPRSHRPPASSLLRTTSRM